MQAGVLVLLMAHRLEIVRLPTVDSDEHVLHLVSLQCSPPLQINIEPAKSGLRRLLCTCRLNLYSAKEHAVSVSYDHERLFPSSKVIRFA